MAVADVYDALAAKRIYKEPWDIGRILDYFRQEKGKHFDPDLVDIVLERFQELEAIRMEYADADMNQNSRDSLFSSSSS